MWNALLRLSHLLLLITVPLCVGAIWSALAQISRSELPAMALLVGASLWPLRPQLQDWPRLLRVVVAAGVTVLGIAYAQAMMGAVSIAGMLGTELFGTLRRMGVEMGLALWFVRTNGLEALLFVLAIVLAAALVWPQPRRH